jgi:hypothetical protein
MVETAKARGLENPGSDEAAVCYDLLEAAIAEAEVCGVPLKRIGLADFDTTQLLRSAKNK